MAIISLLAQGGPIWSHDQSMSVWLDCLNQLHVNNKEPRNRYTDSENWSDIVVIGLCLGSNIELDIALSHLWCIDFPQGWSSNC